MDILDDEVPIEWFAAALITIHACPNIDFLLVTKRPELFEKRMADAIALWAKGKGGGEAGPWVCDWLWKNIAPNNVWMLTSTENQEMLEKRVPALLKIPAVIRGLSCEPLLGPLDLVAAYPWATGKFNVKTGTYEHIHWIIAGGESGRKARPCDVEWIRDIQEQCKTAEVAFFNKQFGALVITDEPELDKWPDGTEFDRNCVSQVLLKDSHGGNMTEWPQDFRVREFPQPCHG
jgi:hypothetical protein